MQCSKFRHTILFIILFLPVSALFAADVYIPLFELVTRGYYEDGIVKLNTRGIIDVDIRGGSKFGGSIGLGLDSEALNEDIAPINSGSTSGEIANYLNSTPYLKFRSAMVSIRDMFNSNTSFSYFVGDAGKFGSDADFIDTFGSTHFNTRLRGFIYFPNSVVYDGLYNVNGTGIKLESGFNSDMFRLQFYTYQNAYLGEGYFTSQIRSLFSSPTIKFEAFTGGSYAVEPYGMYNAGMLFYYNPGGAGSFFSQVGIPRFIPGEDRLNIELFYFLFEPRLKFSIVTLTFTVFWHPQYYNEYIFTETGEVGDIDTNFDIQIGDTATSVVAGGIETNTAFSPDGEDQFRARVSPYFSFVTSGVVWDMKINSHIYPFNINTLFEVFIGVRAEF